ncbi:hypothetical protein BASA81_001845 [Batrachochytrium salamandrivorans]|nr:hypothetical protein BASA81_001845 [Batrachochytrium salamandrivorans]
MVKFVEDPENAEYQKQVLRVVAALVVVMVTAFGFALYKLVRQPPLAKFLNRDKQKAVLLDKIQLSHDTRLFQFALPKNHVLGLPCGQHIKIFCPNPSTGEWNGKPDLELDGEIERKYTPTSSDRDLERFDLVVKVYQPNDKFAHGGKASQYLESLEIGSPLTFSGPWGTVQYVGKGVFNKNRKPLDPINKVAMIAGGTGITPMLQVIEEILLEDDSNVTVHLLFANQTEQDILLRGRLEELVHDNPTKFSVHFTVDRQTNPQTPWSGSVGFVSKAMLDEQLPKFGESTMVLLCGPPPMLKMLKQHLNELDCPNERILEF